MAKAKKKSDKKASETFHNIMKASVKNNPKPKEETKSRIGKVEIKQKRNARDSE